MNVTVYGKPECPQCKYTRVELDKLAAKGQLPCGYTYLDVTVDPEANTAAKATGYTSLPIVVVTNRFRTEKWSGLKLDRLRGLRHTGDY